MKRITAVLSAFSILLASGAMGLERDASSVDSAEVTYQSLKSMSITRVTARTEQAVYGDSGWAILAAVGVGQANHDGVTSPSIWYAGGGLMRVLTSYASLSFFLDYEWADSGKEFQVVTGKLKYRQRLLPSDRPVSPYLLAGIGIADAQVPMWGSESIAPDDFTALILEAGVGCDLAIGQHTSLVIEGTFRDSTGVGDPEYAEHYADGYTAMAALKYYWF